MLNPSSIVRLEVSGLAADIKWGTAPTTDTVYKKIKKPIIQQPQKNSEFNKFYEDRNKVSAKFYKLGDRFKKKVKIKKFVIRNPYARTSVQILSSFSEFLPKLLTNVYHSWENSSIAYFGFGVFSLFTVKNPLKKVSYLHVDSYPTYLAALDMKIGVINMVPVRITEEWAAGLQEFFQILRFFFIKIPLLYLFWIWIAAGIGNTHLYFLPYINDWFSIFHKGTIECHILLTPYWSEPNNNLLRGYRKGHLDFYVSLEYFFHKFNATINRTFTLAPDLLESWGGAPFYGVDHNGCWLAILNQYPFDIHSTENFKSIEHLLVRLRQDFYTSGLMAVWEEDSFLDQYILDCCEKEDFHTVKLFPYDYSLFENLTMYEWTSFDFFSRNARTPETTARKSWLKPLVVLLEDVPVYEDSSLKIDFVERALDGSPDYNNLESKIGVISVFILDNLLLKDYLDYYTVFNKNSNSRDNSWELASKFILDSCNEDLLYKDLTSKQVDWFNRYTSPFTLGPGKEGFSNGSSFENRLYEEDKGHFLEYYKELGYYVRFQGGWRYMYGDPFFYYGEGYAASKSPVDPWNTLFDKKYKNIFKIPAGSSSYSNAINQTTWRPFYLFDPLHRETRKANLLVFALVQDTTYPVEKVLRYMPTEFKDRYWYEKPVAGSK